MLKNPYHLNSPPGIDGRFADEPSGSTGPAHSAIGASLFLQATHNDTTRPLWLRQGGRSRSERQPESDFSRIQPARLVIYWQHSVRRRTAQAAVR